MPLSAVHIGCLDLGVFFLLPGRCSSFFFGAFLSVCGRCFFYFIDSACVTPMLGWQMSIGVGFCRQIREIWLGPGVEGTGQSGSLMAF